MQGSLVRGAGGLIAVAQQARFLEQEGMFRLSAAEEVDFAKLLNAAEIEKGDLFGRAVKEIAEGNHEQESGPAARAGG